VALIVFSRSWVRVCGSTSREVPSEKAALDLAPDFPRVDTERGRMRGYADPDNTCRPRDTTARKEIGGSPGHAESLVHSGELP
jgi:hypothetical protein